MLQWENCQDILLSRGEEIKVQNTFRRIHLCGFSWKSAQENTNSEASGDNTGRLKHIFISYFIFLKGLNLLIIYLHSSFFSLFLNFSSSDLGVGIVGFFFFLVFFFVPLSKFLTQ